METFAQKADLDAGQKVKYIPKGASWLQEVFIPALRSGDYKQTTEKLKRGDAFCILGLCMELRGVDWKLTSEETLLGKEPVWSAGNEQGKEWFEALLPSIAKELGITYDGDFKQMWEISEGMSFQFDQRYSSLVEMNDSGCTFEEISHAIEAALDPENPLEFAEWGA